jgi:hypothetical protein
MTIPRDPDTPYTPSASELHPRLSQRALSFSGTTSAGAPGDPGAPGAPGTPGAAGVGISDIEIDPDGNMIITYTDGTVENVGNVMGPTGPPGSSSTMWPWQYVQQNTPPPNSGQVRTNGSDAASSTTIWVHKLDGSGTDESIWLLAATPGTSRIGIQDKNDATRYAIFDLNADPVDSGSYITFQVALVEHGAPVLSGGNLQILLGIISGGGGGGGGAASSFRYVQPTAASVWTIVHNLGFYPSVTVVDSSHRVVYGEVDYPDVNSVRVTFSAAFGGEAYLS